MAWARSDQIRVDLVGKRTTTDLVKTELSDTVFGEDEPTTMMCTGSSEDEAGDDDPH